MGVRIDTRRANMPAWPRIAVAEFVSCSPMSDQPDAGAERRRLAQADTVNFEGEGPAEPIEVVVPEKYRVERCLGRGGFGVVYLARDTVLDRQVALKFLTDAGPADVARLRREARFTARIDAPGIVKISELGSSAGQFYIAMQFIDGGSLAEADLDRDGQVRVLREVAIALQHAHDHGIVHRDVKPENILLDANGGVYLTDFGIARDVRGRGGGTEGLIVGTPDLMPPEQARGQSSGIDGRSDIYSLGATLYSLLTGRRPFTRRTLVETLYAAIHDAPTLPRTIDPTIPRPLQAIALRCMCKDPGQRYQTAAALASAFDRYLAGEADPNESGGRFTRVDPQAAPIEAPDNVLVLQVAREIADWDTHRYRLSQGLTRTFPALEEVVAKMDGVLGAHPDFAWARFYRGMSLRRLGRLAPALDDLERSVDRFSDPALALFELGRLYLHLALVEQQEPGRHLSFVANADHIAVTEGYLEQAVVAFEEAGRLKAGLDLWQVRYAWAVGLLAAQDYEGCRAACDEILDADPDADEVWRLRGDALRLAGGDPTDSYRKAVEIRRSDYEALHGLGEALLEQGDEDGAAQALDRAIRVHASYVPSLVLRARLHLERQDAEALAPVLDRLERAREVAPLSPDMREDYGAGEGAGRAFVEAAWIDQALKALTDARREADLSNAPGVLAARALLFRARHALAFGEDPRPDLDAVLRRCAPDAGAADTAWAQVLEAAFRERLG